MKAFFKWYMISTISNKEDTAITLLKNRIEHEGPEMKAHFKEIIKFDVPYYAEKENTQEKKIKYQNLYKGYFFIKMDMNDQAWYIVRNTQYITGLVGSHGRGAKPTPISDRHFKKMKDNWEQIINDFKQYKGITLKIKIDDLVKIIDGPFNGDIGRVVAISDDRKVIDVELDNVFGKKAITSFDYKVVEKFEN
ncbi:Transcription antitermination protein nusG [Mesomycoplasma conjunctivae]|nr:transcription termination/antitermination protein NusG [Mesomycoplasma conjunctivae]VEU65954.1 Transcription antitermination protein nusG [Mesomycoplasma conjunctivae]